MPDLHYPAALATMAGSGSASGLAAFVAVKLRLKRHEDEKDASQRDANPPHEPKRLEVANETRN